MYAVKIQYRESVTTQAFFRRLDQARLYVDAYMDRYPGQAYIIDQEGRIYW